MQRLKEWANPGVTYVQQVNNNNNIFSLLTYSIIFTMIISFFLKSKSFYKLFIWKLFERFPNLEMLEGACLSLILLILLFRVHIFKLIFLKIANVLDSFIMLLLIPLVSSCLLFGQQHVSLKLSLTLLIALFFIRILVISTNVNDNSFESERLDLKEFLSNGKINGHGNTFNEQAVNYDLLNRERVIDQLLFLIRSMDNSSNLVIGLNGQWGSGKTTLMKNVKRKLDSDSHKEEYIIIDDFNPWIATNTEAIVQGLILSIFSKINLKISNYRILKYIKMLEKALIGKWMFFDFTSLNNKNDYSYRIPRDFLNNYLLKTKKKLIIIIDNLDRVTPQNIFTILTIVNNFLNINNCAVFLLYDKKILENSLTTINIPEYYLDKIINLEISVPLPEIEDLKTIFQKVLIRLRNEYVQYNDEDNDIVDFCSILAKSKFSLRDFKRYCSLIIQYDYMFKNFDFMDSLVILFIQFYDNNIINFIFDNKRYLVSIDNGVSPNIIISHEDSERSNKEHDNFFDELKQKIKENDGLCAVLILKIMKISFPTVQVYCEHLKYSKIRYINDYQTCDNGSFDKNKYSIIESRRKIKSARFFESYFYPSSQYWEKASEFIKNQQDTFSNATTFLSNIMGNKTIKLGDALSLVSSQMLKFKYQDRISLATVAFNKIIKIESNNCGISISESSYALSFMIISLLFDLNENETSSFWLSYTEDFKYSKLIYDLFLTTFDQRFNENNNYKIQYDYIKRREDSLLDNILKNNINIFVNSNYHRGNSSVIADQKPKAFWPYVKKCASPETIFNIISDLIVTTNINSDANEGSYTLSNDVNSNNFDADFKKILNKAPLRNDAQKDLKKIVDNYFSGENKVTTFNHIIDFKKVTIL